MPGSSGGVTGIPLPVVMPEDAGVLWTYPAFVAILLMLVCWLVAVVGFVFQARVNVVAAGLLFFLATAGAYVGVASVALAFVLLAFGF